MAYLKGNITKVRATPSVLPIQISVVKDYIKVDYNSSDALITTLIWTAIDYVERYTSRILALSNCKATYIQSGEGNMIELLFSDNIVLAEGSEYEVKNNAIYTNDSIVSIEYVAGYNNNELPHWAVIGVCQMVAYMFEHRGDAIKESDIWALCRMLVGINSIGKGI